MNDREFRKLIKITDTEVIPPEGLKEKLLYKVMASEHQAEPLLTPFEKLLFEKPLKAACFISVPISGVLWAVLGSGFAKLLAGVIG